MISFDVDQAKKDLRSIVEHLSVEETEEQKQFRRDMFGGKSLADLLNVTVTIDPLEPKFEPSFTSTNKNPKKPPEMELMCSAND